MNLRPEINDVNYIYAFTNHTILSQYWVSQEDLNIEKIEQNPPAEFTARAKKLESLRILYRKKQNVLEKIPQHET